MQIKKMLLFKFLFAGYFFLITYHILIILLWKLAFMITCLDNDAITWYHGSWLESKDITDDELFYGDVLWLAGVPIYLHSFLLLLFVQIEEPVIAQILDKWHDNLYQERNKAC